MTSRWNLEIETPGALSRSGMMALSIVIVCSLPVNGADQAVVAEGFGELKAEAEKVFRERVTPFIKRHCLECHSNKRPTEAGVNFSPALKNPSHAAFSQQWKKSMARVRAHDMPPEHAEHQPTDADRQMFVDWIARIKYLSEKDPGPFVIRRLTKTEFANTLHDLFGVEPAIANELPDEVSGEGYLNSLSPLQLEHYLTIADKVLDQILPTKDAAPTALQKQLSFESVPPDATSRAAAQRVAESLARKAYRRPPTKAEVEVLLQVFDLGRQNDLAYPQALRLMLKAILVSPASVLI